MSVELLAEIEPVEDAAQLPDGWRGVLDFGELWTEADRHLGWPPDAPEVPVGQPLAYGCEVRLDPTEPTRVRIRLFVVDELRKVMTPGAAFTLRDGGTARAAGHLL